MNTTFFILLPLLLSSVLSALIIPRVLVVTYRKKLFDYPDERKIHSIAIPRLGGFSFLPALLFSFLFSVGIRYLVGAVVPTDILNIVIPEFYFFICGLILLYLAGIKDDLIGMRYRSKFAIQLIAACMLPLSGLWINNLYGLLGIHELAPYIGIPFTLLIIVFIINAINLIDGVDGLAAGLVGISLGVMGTLFYIHHLWLYAMLVFATLGTLIPFFLYNVFGKAERCKKIFMGDTGSLTLGYLVAFLIIRYSSCHPELLPCTKENFVLTFSTLLIPIFDVFRVMMRRGRNRQHIFLPDKNHIHHKLLVVGLRPIQVMLVILFLSLFFYGLNLILNEYCTITTLLVIDVFLYTSINLWLNLVISRKR